MGLLVLEIHADWLPVVVSRPNCLNQGVRVERVLVILADLLLFLLYSWHLI